MNNLPVPVDGVYVEHTPAKSKLYVPQDKNAGPLKAADLRKDLLQAAGVTREELGALLRKAINVANDQLEAVEAQTFAYQGKAGDTVYKADNKVRLKAVETVLKFVDQMPRNKQDDGPKQAAVTINFPNFYSKEFLDNDKKGVIVDVTPDEKELDNDGVL